MLATITYHFNGKSTIIKTEQEHAWSVRSKKVFEVERIVENERSSKQMKTLK
jgi:hypothetical protein